MRGFFLFVGALLLISAFPVVSFSQNIEVETFTIEKDSLGRPILVPANSDVGVPQSTQSNMAEMGAALVEIQDGLSPYVLTDSDGQEALIYVPLGQSPVDWAQTGNIFGVRPFVPSEGTFVTASYSGQEVAEQVLQDLTDAAYERYCNSGNRRPSEIKFIVEVGASFFVSGRVALEAKFVTSELCAQ